MNTVNCKIKIITKKIFITFIIQLLFTTVTCTTTNNLNQIKIQPGPGLFVNTGFGSEILFRNKQNIDKLIEYASQINSEYLFVHVYTSDRYYFDAGELTDKNYLYYSKKSGKDMFEYLIETAAAKGIKTYAWINCYVFVPGRHRLLTKYGNSVMTKDQHGRFFNGRSKPAIRDFYYKRDPMAWLEPGDPRVQKYLLNIVRLLSKRYVSLEGIQLDFIRYPSEAPFVPGARYMKWGYSSGYGEKNIERFMRKYNIYPAETILSRGTGNPESSSYKALLWDRWRRQQITDFVEASFKTCRNSNKKLSASVFAYADRIYFHGSQNWRKWLKNNTIDFVILMNYSLDNEIVYHITKQHAYSYPGKIWIALGAYVMKNSPHLLQQQLLIMKNLNTKGVILFEYFFIKNYKNLIPVIKKNTE